MSLRFLNKKPMELSFRSCTDSNVSSSSPSFAVLPPSSSKLTHSFSFVPRPRRNGLLPSYLIRRGVLRTSFGSHTQDHQDEPSSLYSLVSRASRAQRLFLRSYFFPFKRTLIDAFFSSRQYRFQTLLKLKKSLVDELALMNELAEENMKSYQVW